jgi:hypothetical protein
MTESVIRSDQLAAWHEAVGRVESRMADLAEASPETAYARCLELQTEIEDLRRSLWLAYLDAIRRGA